jgi:hypothetical protein
VALQGGQPTGFVLASALPASPHVSPPQFGWIDAVAVSPAFQRQGIGSALLAWAEGWLADQGCAYARLGGSLRPFAPGLPVELNSSLFFDQHGYHGRAGGAVGWDVAHDLSEYQISNLKYPTSNVDIQPAQPGQEEALLEFFKHSFPAL